MGGKRNSPKKPSLAGLKWILTALSVAVTLGLWQAIAGVQARDSGLEAGAGAVRQAWENDFARAEAGVPAGFDYFPSDVPVKIILAGAQTPRPLAVTRSS